VADLPELPARHPLPLAKATGMEQNARHEHPASPIEYIPPDRRRNRSCGGVVVSIGETVMQRIHIDSFEGWVVKMTGRTSD
jgi:hypothetical protein